MGSGWFTCPRCRSGRKTARKARYSGLAALDPPPRGFARVLRLGCVASEGPTRAEQRDENLLGRSDAVKAELGVLTPTG